MVATGKGISNFGKGKDPFLSQERSSLQLGKVSVILGKVKDPFLPFLSQNGQKESFERGKERIQTLPELRSHIVPHLKGGGSECFPFPFRTFRKIAETFPSCRLLLSWERKGPFTNLHDYFHCHVCPSIVPFIHSCVRYKIFFCLNRLGITP